MVSASKEAVISRIKHSVREEAQCHVCHSPVSVDYPTRSHQWALGITGVRWLLCSKKCADTLSTNGS